MDLTEDPESGPFRLDRPVRQTVPFLFASPHSGRSYPASLLERSRLDATTLRRSEDAFVDELFAGAVGLGAPLLAAHFPRAFLDVNRGIAELDAGMFDGALAVPVDAPSPRVAAGLGVIPRIVRDGAEIYRGKLARGEADARLSQLYKPYHRALAELMEETHARFGAAVLIDCHSMPSALSVPDIVLGDRYGASAAPQLTARAEAAFVRVTERPPHSKWPQGTNLAFVSYAADPEAEVVIALGAVDNLGKGAAGQAVQNMNIMLGLPEERGLDARTAVG